MRQIFNFFASLRLTVVILACSMLLVLMATFEQIQWGVYEVQHRYFETLVALWQYPPEWPGADSLQWLRIPLPGGFLLGGLLVVNLLCAHFKYYRSSWSKAGIMVIHGGLLLLIISGFATAYLQQEYYMWINVGGTSDYLEAFHGVDLALIDHSDPKQDTVVTIPATLLEKGDALTNPALPFSVRTVFYYPNSTFFLRSQNPGAPELPADHGVATNRDIDVGPKPYDYANDGANFASAVVELDTPGGPLGKWLVSTLFDPRSAPPFLAHNLPQTFTANGHTWEITLRPHREYLPYSMTLQKFTHDVYPGTDVPKRFESEVRLVSPSRNEDRPVLIYMNHPLRYEGLTFYQASFSRDDGASMFQVVRNPGWPLPYLAVAMVGFGMAGHFIMSLRKHLRREQPRARTPVAQPFPPPAKLPQTAAVRQP